ncbi:GNAT family N-acetyltransferase [Roseibium denhamense]
MARRFDPSISPFASTCDNSIEALNDLAGLLQDGADRVFLMQAAPVELPEALEAETADLGVLMVQQKPAKPLPAHAQIVPLLQSDHQAMRSLADLTKPGPFTRRTPELGPFWGIKKDDRLIAMAGTRLNLDGFTEVSGVCTHPEYRGHGLASALSAYVADQIRERGDLPILHSYASNTGAIELYRSLGFEVFQDVNVAVVRKKAGTVS